MNTIMRLRAFAALVLMAATSGCGGSGGSTPGAGSAVVPLAPVNTAARSASATIASRRKVGTYAMPSVGGFIAQASFPAVATAAQSTMQVTASLDAPPQDTRISVRRQDATGVLNVLYYLIFTPSVTIALPSLPSVKITLPKKHTDCGELFFCGNLPCRTPQEHSSVFSPTDPRRFRDRHLLSLLRRNR